MKKIIKSLAGILILLILTEHADAFCGLGGIFSIPPAPTCTCGSNKVAIKHLSGNVCQEERCISQGLAEHYLNNGWVYGCCSSSRIGDQFQNEDGTPGTFPNPAISSVTTSFLLNTSQHITIHLLDVNGRIVSTITDQFYEEGRNKVEWNAPELTDGIYFLKFQGDEFLKTEKLIVAK